MDSRLCKKKSLKRSRAGASLIGEHRWIPIKTRVCPGSALRQTARGDPEEALGRMAARPRAQFPKSKGPQDEYAATRRLQHTDVARLKNELLQFRFEAFLIAN
jgi:hypothetical protein